MIEAVTISNFRSLKQVQVGLRPLTVLVGPNDSGKTSFMEAIYRQAQRGGFDNPGDWWRHTQPPSVSLHSTADSASQWGGSVMLLRLPSEGVPMESEGVADSAGTGAPPLDTAGSNLAAFIDSLLRKDRRRFDQIQGALRPLVPGFEEIRISTPSASRRAISLSIEGGLEVAGASLSTGVRLLLFFVALAHHPDPHDVVLVEEPENGVHPKRLRDIVDLLRGLTKGNLGDKKVQVILTTHSPYLLDHIRPTEDGLLVFSREQDGSRTAREADPDRLKTFLDEFMLGEVWFNQGEEGLVSTAR